MDQLTSGKAPDAEGLVPRNRSDKLIVRAEINPCDDIFMGDESEAFGIRQRVVDADVPIMVAIVARDICHAASIGVERLASETLYKSTVKGDISLILRLYFLEHDCLG